MLLSFSLSSNFSRLVRKSLFPVEQAIAFCQTSKLTAGRFQEANYPLIPSGLVLHKILQGPRKRETIVPCRVPRKTQTGQRFEIH